jgi:hypothetical protein
MAKAKKKPKNRSVDNTLGLDLTKALGAVLKNIHTAMVGREGLLPSVSVSAAGVTMALADPKGEARLLRLDWSEVTALIMERGVSLGVGATTVLQQRVRDALGRRGD